MTMVMKNRGDMVNDNDDDDMANKETSIVCTDLTTNTDGLEPQPAASGKSTQQLNPQDSQFMPEIDGSTRNANSHLMIECVILENFKSYAGRRIIGPFHKVIVSNV